MNTLCREHVSANKESIISELVEGKDCATKLKLFFQKPFGPDSTPSAEQLVAKILRSFTQSISVLTSSEAGGEVGQISAISGCSGLPLGTSSCNGRKPDEPDQSRKRSPPPAKDRRGCYKRRKTADTWTKISNSIEDNHAWRKYGQKEILNSKFPRSYFRCTRKHDQGCKALKQVQRIEENPEMFRTTYIGLHTCKDILKAPEMVTDSGNWESYVVPTESKRAPNDYQKAHNNAGRPLISSSSSTPTIKQEYPKEDTPLSEITDNSLEPDLWSDLDFELPEPLKMSTDEQDADAVYSRGTMDLGVDQSVGFGTDHHLRFEY